MKNKIANEATKIATDRTKRLVDIVINEAFDYIEKNLQNVPGMIEEIKKCLENFQKSPEFEQKIECTCAERLAEEGLIIEGYVGLPDNLLISNLHQEGYMSGLHMGYLLSMMAMADNDSPKELIVAVRDELRNTLYGHHYDNREEFVKRYKESNYNWIDRA